MKEKHARSIVKALTWRCIATATTTILVFIFTSDLILSASIGFFDILTKLLFYYVHERVWNIVQWGSANNGKEAKILKS